MLSKLSTVCTLQLYGIVQLHILFAYHSYRANPNQAIEALLTPSQSQLIARSDYQKLN